MGKTPKKGHNDLFFFLDRIYRILWIIILFLPSLMEGRKFNPAVAGKETLNPH
jgi:hypothetical protein